MREADGSRLAPPWPDIAIGCGRRAALATRVLRGLSGGATHTVQVLDPHIDARHFDLVITPMHDRHRVDGANVIHTLGSLHPVTAAWLARGRADFAHLGQLAPPRTAILIGASNRAQRLDRDYFLQLLEQLRDLHRRDGGSFMVSTSRRTDAATRMLLETGLAGLPAVLWRTQDEGRNPYAGMLGWAQRIIVTPDSVNMISEACSVGVPVHTFAPQPIRGKLARFHEALRKAGHLQAIGDPPRVGVAALAETPRVAAQVMARWRSSQRSAGQPK